jgi:bifunctional non-homologous end joining protein LigD
MRLSTAGAVACEKRQRMKSRKAEQGSAAKTQRPRRRSAPTSRRRRRDGTAVQLNSRDANDWTARLSPIGTAVRRIKAKSFIFDGEAVVLGPDGLSRFEELSRREAADIAILYAFYLIEHDGKNMRNRPFLDRKNARLLRNTEAGILINEHIAEDGPVVFVHACRLGAEGIVSNRVDGTYRSGPCPVWIKVRNPAGIAEQRERSEMWNR